MPKLSTALDALLAGAAGLYLTRLPDAGGGATYSATLTTPGGKPRGAVADTPQDAVLALAGTPRTKRCAGACGDRLPLSRFSKDARKPNGRCRACKDCERKRVAAHKRKARRATAKPA